MQNYMYGDYLVVGVSNDDDNGNQSGAMYIFKKDQGGSDNWGQLKKIIHSDNDAYNLFGKSISIYGDYIIGGSASYDNDNKTESGSAFIFKKDQGGSDNWGEFKKLTPSDAVASQQFGYSVDMHDDYIDVGTNEYTLVGGG